MNVEVQVDSKTRDRIATIVRGTRYSDIIAGQVASVIYTSNHTVIKLRFLRDVGFSRFIDELKDGENCVQEVHIVDRAESTRVKSNAEKWYASIRDRGIRKGDEMIYDIQGPTVHTTLISREGHAFVDQIDSGQEPALSVLGGYFASCSEFREDLIRSLYSSSAIKE